MNYSFVSDTDSKIISPPTLSNISAIDSKDTDIEFSLGIEDDINLYRNEKINLRVTPNTAIEPTSTQPPLHNHNLHNSPSSSYAQHNSHLPFSDTMSLTLEIFELMCLQHQLISGEQYKSIIDTISAQSNTSESNSQKYRNDSGAFDFNFMWQSFDSLFVDTAISEDDKEKNRGRSRSPNRRVTRGESFNTNAKKRNAHSTGASSKAREAAEINAANNAASAAAAEANSATMNSNRRSRSHGAARRTKGSDVGAKAFAEKSNLSSKHRFDEDFSVLKCFPADVQFHVSRTKGLVNGVWLVDHPLSLLPPSYYETYNIIQASSLPAPRRVEWMMDLQREYDEQRLQRMEEVLSISRRNIEKQLKSFSKYAKSSELVSSKGKTDKIQEYYKDKFRQPRW